MIGVHTSESLRPFAEEFFQLFKTPWEFYSAGRFYEVLICCGVEPASYNTQLLLIYSGTGTLDGKEFGNCDPATALFVYQEDRIPIYSSPIILWDPITLRIEEGRLAENGAGMTTARIGYNLFLEVAYLLNCGQPARNATTAALELHISLLRDLAIQYTEYLIEIPPRPAGYSMIACLTHDVDHPSLRKSHLWPTILGFLYRATLGSVVEMFRGRRSFAQLVANWRAAFSLPLVYAGFSADIWESFGAYTEMEKTRPSTYFFIPTKGRAGRDRNDLEHPKRAAAYAASEFSSSITSLQREGREIGTHGVDSWRDGVKGVHERQAISTLTGESEIGVRMHWLYYDSQAPAKLERAGYDYDSTVGYNDAVGYRAGTTQAFKPSGVSRLLELPLHIMDTALFYPSYLDLSCGQAIGLISRMVSNAQRFGGVVTVNWHDRSLAPERLWGKVYQNIIEQLSDVGAWFATCRDAVAWFRQRRSIVFEDISAGSDNVLSVSMCGDQSRNNIPPCRLRIHRGKGARFCEQDRADAPYLDFEVREATHDFRVSMQFSESNEVCART